LHFFYCLVCEQWRKELVGGGVLVVVNLNLKSEARGASGEASSAVLEEDDEDVDFFNCG
jgi:hypothetical protein